MRNVNLNNLGLTYGRLDMRDSAQYYLKLLEEALKEQEDDYASLLYHQSMALIDENTKDSCSLGSVIHLVKGLSYAVHINETRLVPSMLRHATNCLEVMPRTAVTQKLAGELLMYCPHFYAKMKESSNLVWFAGMLESYANLEAAYGSREHALSLYKEVAAVVTTMNSNNYFKGLDEAYVKYKSDLKDSEIALLTEREQTDTFRMRLIILALGAFVLVTMLVFLLYNREYKSRKLLDERNHKVEQLLREVHHRVKNNLQIVSSFINIQLDKVKDTSSRQALQDTSSRIMALAGLHQSIYRQDNLSQIQMDEYIRQLCGAISSNLGGAVEIDYELQPLQLDIDQAIPVGLAVNELITNAIKHAFPAHKRGHIHIRLSGGNVCELEVRDDGRGLPESLDTSELSSIGLRLVRDITETQLKGTCSFCNDGGTVCTIRFQPVAA
jgi:two-component sensor histidine kinase